MSKSRYPSGWDKDRVNKVLEAYESQTEEEAVAEDEATFEAPDQTVIEVPTGIVPKVRQLIAEYLSRTKPE